jgi:hypothetical protein
MKTFKNRKSRKSRKSRRVRKTNKNRSHRKRVGGGRWIFVQWLDSPDEYYRHDAMTEYQVRGPHRSGKWMLFKKDVILEG